MKASTYKATEDIKKTRIKLLNLLDGTTRCGMKSALSGVESRLGGTEDVGLRAFLQK